MTTEDTTQKMLGAEYDEAVNAFLAAFGIDQTDCYSFRSTPVEVTFTLKQRDADGAAVKAPEQGPTACRTRYHTVTVSDRPWIRDREQIEED